MIPLVPQDAPDRRRALQQHLAAELEAVETGVPLDPVWRQSLADSVAAFCAEEEAAEYWTEDYLHCLIGRAMAGVGMTPPEGLIPAPPFAAGPAWDSEAARSFQDIPLTPLLWRSFASRLIRPARWLSFLSGPVWLLDLGRLHTAEKAMELQALPTLRFLLENMANLWQPSRGHGSLGITGLDRLAEKIPERQELMDYCRRVLESIQQRHGWPESPQIINLDWWHPRQVRRKKSPSAC